MTGNLELTHSQEKLALTGHQLFAFSTPKITILFSRAFLSFSTSRSLENPYWTRLLP
jgi:hypothetical protein